MALCHDDSTINIVMVIIINIKWGEYNQVTNMVTSGFADHSITPWKNHQRAKLLLQAAAKLQT